MPSVLKCPKCGLELADTQARQCPLCATPILPAAKSMNVWIIAAIQFALAATFMLIFKFPKPMIVFFGLFILVGTALSKLAKAKAAAPQPVPPKVARPVPYGIFSFLIAICALVLFSTVLFGSVMFLNSWNRWHKYEGQPFHRADFQVGRVYFQKYSKSTDSYASGTVEGNREWMSLEPYLGFSPHREEDLDARVSPGTVIPVYFFPDMKGRARVQVYTEEPPAETSRRMAMKELNNSLLILGAVGVTLLVLVRLRKLCVAGDGTNPSIS